MASIDWNYPRAGFDCQFVFVVILSDPATEFCIFDEINFEEQLKNAANGRGGMDSKTVLSLGDGTELMISRSQQVHSGQAVIVWTKPVVYIGPAEVFLEPGQRYLKGELKKHYLNRFHIEVMNLKNFKSIFLYTLTNKSRKYSKSILNSMFFVNFFCHTFPRLRVRRRRGAGMSEGTRSLLAMFLQETTQ